MKRALLALLLVLVACRSGDQTTAFLNTYSWDGKITYFHGSTSEFPEALRWKKLPIEVSMDEEASYYQEPVIEAIAFWNRSLGKRFFAFSKDPAEVRITLGTFTPSQARIGETNHYMEHGHLRAEITIKRAGSYIVAFYLVSHELGHVLGLAHVEDETNVMYRLCDIRTIHVSNAAKNALLDVYFP